MAHKILVVDDENDMRQVVSQRLSMHGYQIEQAADGLEAIDKVKAFEPDVMLLDVNMPHMDGKEVCQKIRSNHKNQNVKIIFLTANGDDWDLLEGFHRGGDSYLVKPVMVDTLLKEIERVLKA